jgi:hypothetical protein
MWCFSSSQWVKLLPLNLALQLSLGTPKTIRRGWNLMGLIQMLVYAYTFFRENRNTANILLLANKQLADTSHCVCNKLFDTL